MPSTPAATTHELELAGLLGVCFRVQKPLVLSTFIYVRAVCLLLAGLLGFGAEGRGVRNQKQKNKRTVEEEISG